MHTIPTYLRLFLIFAGMTSTSLFSAEQSNIALTVTVGSFQFSGKLPQWCSRIPLISRVLPSVTQPPHFLYAPLSPVPQFHFLEPVKDSGKLRVVQDRSLEDVGLELNAYRKAHAVRKLGIKDPTKWYKSGLIMPELHRDPKSKTNRQFWSKADKARAPEQEALQVQLLKYVWNGRTDHVRALLDEYPSIDLDLPCVYEDNKEMRHPFDPAGRYDYGPEYTEYTHLGIALFKGDMPMFKLLLARGADPNRVFIYKDTDRSPGTWETPLSAAYRLERKDFMHVLFDSNKTKSIDEPIGYLMSSMEHHNKIQELSRLENWDLETRKNHTCNKACRRHFRGCTVPTSDELILARHNLYGCYDWYTLLMLAAERRDDETVELLVAKGAKVDAVNKKGKPALVYAARHGHVSTVRLLLGARANPNGCHEGTRTPLAHACEEGHLAVAHTLLDAGASINQEDLYGDNPLIMALYTLCDASRAPDRRRNPDLQRKTPAECAEIMDRQKQVIACLLARGADVNHKGKFERHAVSLLDEFSKAQALEGHKKPLCLLNHRELA